MGGGVEWWSGMEGEAGRGKNRGGSESKGGNKVLNGWGEKRVRETG